MRLFGYVCLLLSVTGLSACGTLNKEPEPLKFSDTEQNLKAASFMKSVGGSGKIAGAVSISGGDWLDIVRMNDDLSIAVRNENGKSSADNLKSLASSKGFTLYTFSKYAGTVEVNSVKAVKNICTDYRNQGVKVTIADNLYDKQGNMVVFRSKGNIAASKTKSKVQSAELDYTYTPDLSNNTKNMLEKEKQNMIAVHYARLEELIARGICS